MTINIGQFDAIIFDLDGTLVDSLPDMVLALNRLLEDEGRRGLGETEVRPLIGRGASKMIQSSFLLTGDAIHGDDLDKAVADYISYYKQFPAKESTVYEGVRVVLDELQGAGIKMGICSNKGYEMVSLILKSFDLAKYFCGVTGGDSVAFNKPDGRHILETLKRMNVSSKNVLMVGDTVNDVAAALDAGLPVVAVDYGYSSSDELLSATKVVGGFFELSLAYNS
jgi:phosphoglycolate phosphatase